MSATGGLTGHGGRLCVARALYPHAPEPWIDLSTGINPEPYPDVRASAEARGRLPTPEETRALEGAAGRAFGVDDADRVAAAAGSEAVLRLMPYVLRLMPHVAPLDAAVVVGPTYSSHAAAWRGAGIRVAEMSDAGVATVGAPLDALASIDTRVGLMHDAAHLTAGATRSHMAVTLVNPNNPDGASVARARLLTLHDEVSSRDGYLVVDEAFADVAPTCSVAALAGSARYPRLIVLRSFGKFYGLAGVRLGFVIAGPPVIARVRELLGDWPVSADAIAVGLAAYADDEWAERTRERLLHSAQRLDDLLISSGLAIVGGTSLFRLARSDDARDRFDRLLRAGILVRPFDHDTTLLRFGLPHEPSAWRRLADALRKP